MEKIDDVFLSPRVGSVYGYGWDIMKKYFLPLFLVLIITAIVGMPAGLMNDHGGIDIHEMTHRGMGIVFLQIFGLAYILFVVNPIEYGAQYLNLKAVRNETFEIKEIFDGFKNYLNVVLAALLVGSIVVIGFIFLIVPGIVFACRLAFVPYLVMDKKLDPVKAVEESWRLTKGYGWRIFGMALLAIPIFIAGLIVLVFGVLVSIMWISASFAAMYHAVLKERGETELSGEENTITEEQA